MPRPFFQLFLVCSCFLLLTSSVQVTPRIRMTKATNSKNKSHKQRWGMCPFPICFFFIFFCLFHLFLFFFYSNCCLTLGYYNFDNGNHTQAMEMRARKWLCQKRCRNHHRMLRHSRDDEQQEDVGNEGMVELQMTCLGPGYVFFFLLSFVLSANTMFSFL